MQPAVSVLQTTLLHLYEVPGRTEMYLPLLPETLMLL